MGHKRKDQWYMIVFGVFIIVVFMIASIQVLSSNPEILNETNAEVEKDIAKSKEEILIGQEWLVIYKGEEPFLLNSEYHLEQEGQKYYPLVSGTVESNEIGIYPIVLTSPKTQKKYEVVIQVIEHEEN